MAAVVDLERCMGCGLCADICPYDGVVAIKEWKSRINESTCGRCGVCVGICPSLALNIQYLTSSLIIARVEALLKTTRIEPVFKPRIIIFICDWLSRKGANLGDISSIEHSSNVRSIKLPCIGALDPRFIPSAFLSGGDGVLVVGCDPEDCDYLKASKNAEPRVSYAKMVLKDLGIEPERLGFELIPLAEARTKFVESVRRIIEAVKSLGPTALTAP